MKTGDFQELIARIRALELRVQQLERKQSPVDAVAIRRTYYAPEDRARPYYEDQDDLW